MNPEELYELVLEATRHALRDERDVPQARLVRRLVDGNVHLIDGQGRLVKEIPVASLLSKVTAVRERLRVLEQKLNNHDGLDAGDKAELQGLITRCYGSLTTFNLLFADEADKFVGTGGR
jgi:hypothetical protein